MYKFEIGKGYLKKRTMIYQEDEYSDFYRSSGIKCIDSKVEKIKPYFENFSKMEFTYDFGDEWNHDIELIKKIEGKIINPICTKYKGGAYPEDCGGVDEFELYNEEDNEREEPDLELINGDLEDYKEFADIIYSKEFF